MARELRPRGVDVAVKAPFRRWRLRARGVSGAADENEVARFQRPVRHGGRSDDESMQRAARAARRHVAGFVDVDPGRVHRERRFDHGRAKPGTVVRERIHRDGPSSSSACRCCADVGRSPLEPRRHAAARRCSGKSSPSRPGSATPRSVMMPVTKRAGVTSNAGLATGVDIRHQLDLRQRAVRVEACHLQHLARARAPRSGSSSIRPRYCQSMVGDGTAA